MTLSPLGHPSSYQLTLNSFKIQQNAYLMQSAFTPVTPLGQPLYAFGSDAAIMYGLGQTIAVLKSAAASGVYGTGTHVNTLA